MAAGDITAQLQTASKFNAALFDGVDDYVEIPHHDSQLGANLSNGFTISAWINPRSYGKGGVGRILDKSIDSNAVNGFRLFNEATGRIGFDLHTGTVKYSATSAFLPNGSWYHLLITVNSSSIINFYKNATLSGTANQDLVQAISTITTTNAMRIGNRATATDLTFDGGIRDVKMWNRVLSTTEITEEYNGKHHSEGCILNVPLDKDYNDYSTLGLTGTNSGTILTNNMKNKIIADTKGLNLPTVTDKIIALPLMGRSEVVKIVTAKRATA